MVPRSLIAGVPDVGAPVASARVHAALSHRWSIIGTTGTGKTTFGLELLRQLRKAYPAARTYILDSKQPDPPDFHEYLSYALTHDDAPDALRSPGGVQLWQPGEENLSEYDRWFARILGARKPAIVFVDELSTLASNSGQTFSAVYPKLLKQGRAHHICVISLSQEAAYIPRQTLNQINHLVRFGLQDEYDARKVDKLLARERSEFGVNPPHRYGFHYKRLDVPMAMMTFKDWREFF